MNSEANFISEFHGFQFQLFRAVRRVQKKTEIMTTNEEHLDLLLDIYN